ncbi:hypothetical protein ncot_01295 [Nocardioides sp. JQ2195]|uniref:hypothetical protein n=1 Tax=Nocardioides sp. JQ2195 TaxID=2592334 RepID=UPI00143E7435|nr:hypothetical protein [Nocardioides sp. JQ2195]QIX25372.1 hypothetical protein ncot_01295 [Nocardioides sp. JQ2195]
MRGDRSHSLLRVPDGWSVEHEPRSGIVATMTPRKAPDSGLAPAITLTRSSTGLGVREHLDQLRSLVEHTFDKVDIEDADVYDYHDVDVAYLRFFHRTPRHDVIVEIWNWLVDGQVWSMAASADHRDHPDYTDVFDDVAATFDPTVREVRRLARPA